MRWLVLPQTAVLLLVISFSARVPRTRGFAIISSSSKQSLHGLADRRFASHNEDFLWSASSYASSARRGSFLFRSLLLLEPDGRRNDDPSTKTCLYTSAFSQEQTGSFSTTNDDSSNKKDVVHSDDDNDGDEGQTFHVTFSSYRNNLELLRRGDSVASEPFAIRDGTANHKFRVLLYPRGGGHSSSSNANGKQENKEEGGFGMSYKVGPMMPYSLFANIEGDPKNDKLGVYLEYLGTNNDDTHSNNSTASSSMVDATFTLRLKGKQSLPSSSNNNSTTNPRFDVEWSAGM
eukprot:scaffold42566_cov24-Attheya_sp.AAC.1